MMATDDSFSDSFALRKVTKGIIAIHKKVPGTGEDGPSPVGSSLAVGITRKYAYVVLEQNGEKEGYNLS